MGSTEGGTPAAGSTLSRARLFAAGAGGGIALWGLRSPERAFAGDRAPTPIPGGFDADGNMVPTGAVFHVLPPAIGLEMATITDFAGDIAAAEIQGTAHGSDGSSYTFDADMRAMSGTYVASDGRVRTATFGFV